MGGKKKKINGVCIVVRNYLLKVNNLLFYVYIVKIQVLICRLGFLGLKDNF